MTTQTITTEITTDTITTGITTDPITTDVTDIGRRTIRSETECRARANEFLTELIGSPPEDLVWDDTHHLQGHSHLHGHELVVIAPRDDEHQTVVLTIEDWDAVRIAGAQHVRTLLDACAIADHNRLVAVLSGRQHWAERPDLAA